LFGYVKIYQTSKQRYLTSLIMRSGTGRAVSQSKFWKLSFHACQVEKYANQAYFFCLAWTIT
jgi:hypothetical protein